MAQMYKVFIDSLTVYFTNIEYEVEKKSKNKTIQVSVTKDNVQSIFSEVENYKKKNEQILLFICEDIEATWEFFKKQFDFRIAAGGLVLNEENNMLLIYRNGYWDLPKGHVEKNEEIDKGAIREVEEECGITNPRIIKKLLTTYHTYSYKGNDVLKENHWFLMRASSEEKLIPQTEEGIEIVAWKSREEVFKCLENSFGSIVDVAYFYFNLKN